MPSEYTTEEKLDFLAGQVRALSAMVQVLVAARPDAEQFLAKTDSLLAGLVDLSVAEALTDAHEDGLSDVRTKLTKAVAIFQANKK